MDDNKSEIVKMYEGGLATEAIAEELDIPASEVRKALQDEGLMLKQGRKSSAEGLSEDSKLSIINEYLEEKTPAVQLLAKYSITWNAFYKILTEANVPYRQMQQENKLAREMRLDRAIEMYQGGARIWEIENETGIRQPVLHSTLHQRGIPLRRQAQGLGS